MESNGNSRSGFQWARLRSKTGDALVIAQSRFNTRPSASNWLAVIEAMGKFQEADYGLEGFYASFADRFQREAARVHLEETRRDEV